MRQKALLNTENRLTIYGIRKVSSLLFGANAQNEMSFFLDVKPSTINRILEGEKLAPIGWTRELYALLEERFIKIREILRDFEEIEDDPLLFSFYLEYASFESRLTRYGLSKIGQALYGDNWKKSLAHILGVDSARMRDIVNNNRNPPPGWTKELYALLHKKYEEYLSLKKEFCEKIFLREI